MNVYLDNSSTTQPLPEVIKVVQEAMSETFGNPSSGHRLGHCARRRLETARGQVAEFLDVGEDQVVFTSGATEANNMVVWAALQDPNARLVTTSAEHPAVVGPFSRHPERTTLVPLDRSGIIDLDALFTALATRPYLLAISWVNSETGVVQPVDKICRMAREAGVLTLIDASQAAGRLPRQALAADYDFLSVSAHKMNGPKGVGCLVISGTASAATLLYGGGQEDGRRSGTENLPGIAGFGEACRVRGLTLDIDLERVGGLRDRFEIMISSQIPHAVINGAASPRVPMNTNIMFPGIDAMALVAKCDAEGISFSQVSACSTGRPEPSRTLREMGLDEASAYASARFSLSVMTTEEDIQTATTAIIREVKHLESTFGRVA
ncbi:cysteine desulfurase family protein [Roseicyclus marinus]|uniref:cysteine desulfurase family protein n=1 Tax=Roseicyclus marinus TaxID=2161673 RepID=UPI0024105C7B|nr:cysteine desulfurase family protein [Roseicyclus marinus]MDG3043127.1 cysteine desulfurase family protein [Roseicyclus marinus]